MRWWLDFAGEFGNINTLLAESAFLPKRFGIIARSSERRLAVYKQLCDQSRDSLTYIFDLLVTKTALPLVTLLLGYLFGKTKS
jgi:hypothetical protein